MKPQCFLCQQINSKQIYVINRYKIYKCFSCNFVYSYPNPTIEDLKKTYKDFTYKEGFANELLIRRDAKRILSNFDSFGIKKNSLLDLGSGAGFLLDEARSRGWQVTGVEVAKAPLKHAEEKLKLQIIKSDLNEFITRKKFDAIVLSQVIEHLVDPTPVLNKIRQSLAKNGIACISTPNIESLLSQILKRDFNYLTPPNHVLFFSPTTLKKLLEDSGFQVIKSITYGYPEDIGIMYRKIREMNAVTLKQQKEFKSRKNKITNNKSLVTTGSQSFKNKVFENVIRGLSVPVLDLFKKGSMIEMYVRKK